MRGEDRGGAAQVLQPASPAESLDQEGACFCSNADICNSVWLMCLLPVRRQTKNRLD